jgi:hypothetical protein
MRESLRRRIENLESRGPSPAALREAMRRRRESGELSTDPVLAAFVLNLEAIIKAMEATIPGPPSSAPLVPLAGEEDHLAMSAGTAGCSATPEAPTVQQLDGRTAPLRIQVPPPAVL